MDYTNGFISIQIKYKIYDIVNNTLLTKINNILENFNYIIEDDYVIDKKNNNFDGLVIPEYHFLIYYIEGHENYDFFENFFDNLRKEMKLRYMIKCYNPTKKYPSSIRINVKGQKINTKQQTKLFGL